jgi:hypothetical protein
LRALFRPPLEGFGGLNTTCLATSGKAEAQEAAHVL